MTSPGAATTLHARAPAPTVGTYDHDGGITMGFIGKAMKSGIALKAGQMLIRQAQKPENQRKAKELLAKAKRKR
ncbi:hypothetical protein [uncultured Cellulomonas sp.]|uniref:hypothetical protein n=1 Tax=uncultured Cellulomonas sp. TaxID=189682 RepID=UPI00262C8363|nr:hypothetical protein [uncultured Cellulomonas sp.]